MLQKIITCFTENFVCGLCAFEAKTLENLDLHIKTCEIYECAECEYISKQLSGIKEHISESSTKCSLSSIFHLKMDRENEAVANCKEYKQSELY